MNNIFISCKNDYIGTAVLKIFYYYLGADIRDIVVHRPVLRYRRSRGPAGNPARRLEDRGHADQPQEPPPLSEGGKRREHLESETDVV